MKIATQIWGKPVKQDVFAQEDGFPTQSTQLPREYAKSGLQSYPLSAERRDTINASSSTGHLMFADAATHEEQTLKHGECYLSVACVLV